MKRIFILLISLCLWVQLCGFTQGETVMVAEGSVGSEKEESGTIVKSEMFDEADVFTEDEEEMLLLCANDTADETKTEVVFWTYTDANGQTTESFSDDFCDAMGFGYDRTMEEGDFIMLIFDFDNRDIYVKTGGTAVSRVSDREIDRMLDEIYGELGSNDYFDAAMAFVTSAQTALTEDTVTSSGAYPGGGYTGPDSGNTSGSQSGNPSSGSADQSVRTTRNGMGWAARLVIAAIIGAAVTAILYFTRNTGKTVTAEAYMDSAPRVVRHSDRFINTTVVRTRIPKNNSKGGGRHP